MRNFFIYYWIKNIYGLNQDILTSQTTRVNCAFNKKLTINQLDYELEISMSYS